MPRKCVCTNPKCDKDVERFAFALGRHWKDDTLRSILSGLRPKADRDDIEKYFLRAMTKPDAARVSSRHFCWHTLAWSPGDRPTLVFKDGAHKRPTYVLHSNRPTYAGEPIVDPTRIECISPRETRLRTKAPAWEPLSDISNLNDDGERATRAGVRVGIKRRRSAPAAICSRERAQNTCLNSFEVGRPAEETCRVQEMTIEKLRCEKLKLSEALRVEHQRADVACQEVRLLTEVIEQFRKDMRDHDRAALCITMRHLRATRVSNEQIKALTGWPSLKTFDALWRFVNAGDRNATQNLLIRGRQRRSDSASVTDAHKTVVPRKKSFEWEDIFLAWWMRAKMDLSVDQLAYFVGMRKATLTRALQQMTSFLTVFIRAYGGDPIDPEWIQMTTGEDWKEAYGQKPYEIIDVTEVPMETPDDPYMQRLFYSHYKKRYVCKFLGACHPNCLAAFCSVGFPGSIFDNEICFAGKDHPMLNHAAHRASIRRRTFTDKNDENVVVPETIAADRGFCEGLNRQFERDAFRLVHPAFSRGKNVAFSKEDILDTRAQACRRELIENAFGRVKTIWKRMRGPIAISKLKSVHQEWPIIFFLALDLQAPLR